MRGLGKRRVIDFEECQHTTVVGDTPETLQCRVLEKMIGGGGLTRAVAVVAVES